jgi:four helix bundle protein
MLRNAESMADRIWGDVLRWDAFARKVLGSQLTRAADSIGANIAESFGRYLFRDKIQFLFYARGSLFETKYWLSRARERTLVPVSHVEELNESLHLLAKQLNSFIASLRAQQSRRPKHSGVIGEPAFEYGSAEVLASETDGADTVDFDGF